MMILPGVLLLAVPEWPIGSQEIWNCSYLRNHVAKTLFFLYSKFINEIFDKRMFRWRTYEHFSVCLRFHPEGIKKSRDLYIVLPVSTDFLTRTTKQDSLVFLSDSILFWLWYGYIVQFFFKKKQCFNFNNVQLILLIVYAYKDKNGMWKKRNSVQNLLFF